MLVRRPIAVDDNHLPAFCQRRPHPPQKGVRLFNLMIHVHHEYPVKAVLRQAGIVDRTFLNRNIVELLAGDTLPKPVQRAAINVLRLQA